MTPVLRPALAAPPRMLVSIGGAVSVLLLAAWLVGLNYYRASYGPPGEAKVEDEDLSGTCFLRTVVCSTREAWILVLVTNALTILAITLAYSLGQA